MMDRPMIVWCVITGTLFSVFVIRTLRRLCAGGHSRRPGHLPLFEWGKEREMFYIPGDWTGDEDEEKNF